MTDSSVPPPSVPPPPYVDPNGRSWGTVRAMAVAYGLHEDTVRKRLRRGHTVAKALRPYDESCVERRQLGTSKRGRPPK